MKAHAKMQQISALLHAAPHYPLIPSLIHTIIGFALLCSSASVSAHEFWVEPNPFIVQPGGKVVITLRVGERMRGKPLSFHVNHFQSFTLATHKGIQYLKGTEDDSTAVSYNAIEQGLNVLAYHSTANQVTFDDWETFRSYLAEEGLEEVAKKHQMRNLPEQGFKENYTRYAKALINVGTFRKQDQDVARGVPLELVAADNPYQPGLKTVRIRLLSFGQPVPNRQITIFRYDGAISRSVITTDVAGQAIIPVSKGGSFLLNAIDIQALENEAAVWSSYWASLTFSLPIILTNTHPLDPLSTREIKRTIRAIAKSGHATSSTRVALITLAEPDKTSVLAWKSGKPAERRAFAIIRNGSKVFEAKIELATGKLEQWHQVHGVQPPIQSTEWAIAQSLIKQDPRWITAMHARGYNNFSDIFCESMSAGFFNIEENREKRLLNMPCFDLRGAESNIYGRPIEGLISVVDLNKNEVVRVIDTGPVPISENSHSFDEASVANRRAPMRPIRVRAPDGWNFSIDDRLINWQGWSFHLSFDQRFGPILSLVTHEDDNSRRMILYQGHLSEVFVPYMDPTKGWYYRSFMDVGEYGIGALASPLEAGVDCAEGSAFINAELASPNGTTYTRERVMCVFERDAAAPLWRHWEALNGNYEGRPATELVVRSIPAIGNYDYILDWVFTQKGELHINIGATGIDAVKGVPIKNMRSPGAEDAARSGALVAPNLVAVHHDHFFSVRLDIDIDGPINSFVRERLVTNLLPAEHPRRSLWQLEPTPMPSEGALTASNGPEFWRIENPDVETSLGHNPSFQIAGGSNATSLLHPEDWPQRRAVFSSNTLWITAQHPGELHAAGPYPNQSPGGQGLNTYVNGENIISTDIVAWYTIGFHHLTRPEDWPVLPTMWHGFKLRPYGFFTNNPGVGVRRHFVGDNEKSE